MTDKRNIFLIGPIGSGKSTIGRQLAQQLCMTFYDTDQEIESSTGADINWVFDVEGEEKFREREEKIIHTLTEKQNIVLSTGGGAIQSRETRNRLSARGVVIYLQVSIEVQLARTQRDKKRPMLQGVTEVHPLLVKLASTRNPLYEEIADISVCTDQQNTKIVTGQIISLLNNY